MLLGLLEPCLSFLFVNLGLDRTSASSAAILIALEAPAGALIAAAVLRERLSVRGAIAIGITVAGAGFIGVGGGGQASLSGNLLVALGSLCAGGFTVAARRLAPDTPALTMAARQFLISVPMGMPLVLAGWLSGGSELGRAGPVVLAAAILTGLLGSALAFWLFGLGLARVSVATASTLLNLVPVFGVLFAVVFLGDGLALTVLVGGALVLAGIAIANHGAAASASG